MTVGDVEFAMSGYMMILGITMLVIHRISMLVILENRFKVRYSVLILIGDFVLSGAIKYFIQNDLGWSGLTTLVSCVIFIWILKAPVFQVIFAFYFNHIITAVILYLTEFGLAVFVSRTHENYNLILFVTMLVIYAGYVFLVWKYGRAVCAKLFQSGRSGEWALYAFGAFFTYIVLTFSRDFPGTTLLDVTLLLFAIWCFAILCFAIINTHEKTKQKSEADFARDMISHSQEHYVKIKDLYDALRFTRHDYKFHLNAIQDMLRRGEIEKSDAYLAGLQQDLDTKEYPIFCDNPVINSIVSYYAELSKKAEIDYSANILIPEKYTSCDYDICVVLGNLLQNALDACQNQNKGFIQLVIKPQGKQLAIMVRNSFGETTKKENGSGLGLRSVQSVADRHNGDMLIEQDGDTYKVFITLRA